MKLPKFIFNSGRGGFALLVTMGFAAIALAAMDRHLSVLIEKPVTLLEREAATLVERAKAQGIHGAVDHIHLYQPAFRRLKALLPQIGRITGIAGIAGNLGPYRSDCSVLWDWAPHDVAMVLAVTGLAPAAVTARHLPLPPPIPDHADHVRLDLDFASGLKAELDVSNHRAVKTRRVTVQGTLATLVYDDLAERKLTASDEALDVGFTPGSPLLTALQDFADAIAAGSTDITGLELGLDVVRVLQAADASL